MIPSSANPEATPCLMHLDTLEAAARVMRATDTSVLPVTRNGKLVGVISDRDIVVRMVAEGLDGWLTRVCDFMTTPPVYCHEDDAPDEILLAMRGAKIDTIPLVDREDRVIGMLGKDQVRRAHFASERTIAGSTATPASLTASGVTEGRQSSPLPKANAKMPPAPVGTLAP